MTLIPNFSDLPLESENRAAGSLDDWRAKVADGAEKLRWQTPEQIPVQPLYTSAERGVRQTASKQLIRSEEWIASRTCLPL